LVCDQSFNGSSKIIALPLKFRDAISGASAFRASASVLTIYGGPHTARHKIPTDFFVYVPTTPAAHGRLHSMMAMAVFNPHPNAARATAAFAVPGMAMPTMVAKPQKMATLT
jgi:hypothetical protein